MIQGKKFHKVYIDKDDDDRIVITAREVVKFSPEYAKQFSVSSYISQTSVIADVLSIKIKDALIFARGCAIFLVPEKTFDYNNRFKIVYIDDNYVIIHTNGFIGYPRDSAIKNPEDYGLIGITLYGDRPKILRKFLIEYMDSERVILIITLPAIDNYPGYLIRYYAAPTEGLIINDTKKGEMYALVHPFDNIKNKLKEIASMLS